jgi:hypothetical protein
VVVVVLALHLLRDGGVLRRGADAHRDLGLFDNVGAEVRLAVLQHEVVSHHARRADAQLPDQRLDLGVQLVIGRDDLQHLAQHSTRVGRRGLGSVDLADLGQDVGPLV